MWKETVVEGTEATGVDSKVREKLQATRAESDSGSPMVTSVLQTWITRHTRKPS